MAKYRWSNPQEWLGDKLTQLANDDEYPEILEIARTLSGMVDADQVQNLFQNEMDSNGYFTSSDLMTCDECGEGFDPSQMADPEQHLTLDREQAVCLDCHRDWLNFENLTCKACSCEQPGCTTCPGQGGSDASHEGSGEADDRPNEG
jgi:hypothetical protein